MSWFTCQALRDRFHCTIKFPPIAAPFPGFNTPAPEVIVREPPRLLKPVLKDAKIDDKVELASDTEERVRSRKHSKQQATLRSVPLLDQMKRLSYLGKHIGTYREPERLPPAASTAPGGEGDFPKPARKASRSAICQSFGFIEGSDAIICIRVGLFSDDATKV